MNLSRREVLVGVAALVAAPKSFAAQSIGPLSAAVSDRVKATTNPTELPPNLEAFMGSFLQRFDQNTHNLPCHTPENRVVLERKLRANPEKLAAMKTLEDWGGEPDVTEVNGEEIFIDELARFLPDSRGGLTFAEAEQSAAAFGGGTKLMNTQRYQFIGIHLKIHLDLGRGGVWLDSSNPDSHIELPAENAFYGGAPNMPVLGYVGQRLREDKGGFRCSLVV